MENSTPSGQQRSPLHDAGNMQGRAVLLRAEHERAMSLLAKEKASAVAVAAAAKEKGRKVEAALQAVAMAQEDMDRQAREQEEKVSQAAGQNINLLVRFLSTMRIARLQYQVQ